MADDSVTLNDANDAPFKVAVDTVGQRDFQVVKLAIGAEDTATYVSSAQGATDSGTVRVVAASDDPGVAAAQTANTLLTNIDGHIDGVEALLATGNAALTAIDGYVDGIEALMTTANTLATTANTTLSGVATQTTLAAVLAKMLASPATEALQTALNTLVGDQNAAAWASGDGTLISLLKAIAGSAISLTPASTNQTQVNGVTALTGNGVTGTGSMRVTVAADNTPYGIKLTQDEYETVAASQTAQTIGSTGATGDYLAGVLVIPASTSPGVVTILDNATSINVFAGGASSLSNLVPFFIPIGAKSVSGAWKVTTGTNVSVVAVGDFT